MCPEPAPADKGSSSPKTAEPSLARRSMDFLWRLFQRFNEHRIMSQAAAVTYYGLLAIFPALAAIVAIYGLFADPVAINAQLQSLSTVLPGGALTVVGNQIRQIATEHGATFGIAFIGGLALSLWSASSGIKALFDALNVVHDEQEERSFLRLSLIALLFTIGAIAVLVLALIGTVVVPVALNRFGLAGPAGWGLSLVRWVLLFVFVDLALSVTYRFGPSHALKEWRWISWGSAFATLAWLAMSALFSWYAANFGSFNATYGSLGAVIGFMIWLWLSATVILLGAQIDAELQPRAAPKDRA